MDPKAGVSGQNSGSVNEISPSKPRFISDDWAGLGLYLTSIHGPDMRAEGEDWCVEFIP